MYRTGGIVNGQQLDAGILQLADDRRQCLYGFFLAICIMQQHDGIIPGGNIHLMHRKLYHLLHTVIAAFCVMVIGIPVIIFKAPACHFRNNFMITATAVHLSIAAARETEALYPISGQVINFIICFREICQISFRGCIQLAICMLIGMNAQGMAFIHNTL